MATKLYVGNLAYSTSSDRLRELFEAVGEVLSATIIMDRETGRSKGFGFVEMTNEDEAKAAIQRYDGQVIDQRTLKVNEARPREDRPGGGGGGGGAGRWGNGGGDRRGPGAGGDRRGGNGGGDRRGGGNRY
jgi:RNA recognition motif-containing protein